MWGTEQQERARQERARSLERQDAALRATGVPLDLMQRMRRATRHCEGGLASWKTPPREIYCQDAAGETLRRSIDLRDLLGANNEWLAAIARHAALLGRAQAARCVSLDLSGTSVTDAGVAAAVSALPHVATLGLSRCASLTDESLTAVRRHLSRGLRELRVDDCRRLSSDVLCLLWTDCRQLRALSASGCPGVSDRLLRCIASSPRASPEARVASIDVRRCRNVTSAGLACLAAASAQHVALEQLRCGNCPALEPTAFFSFEASDALRSSLVALDLRGLDAAVDDAAVSWIARGCASAPRLARLNLSRCSQVSDLALLLLAPVVAGRSFRKLDLQECVRITDRGIHDLLSAATVSTGASKDGDDDSDSDSDAPSVELRSLNLRDCAKLGDAALDAIGARCPRLAKLGLKGLRKVSDRGVLSVAKGCPRLATLELSGRRVTALAFTALGRLCRELEALDVSDRRDLDSPACVMHLTPTPASSLLRRVDLSATNVCDAGVSVLAVACPRLEWISLSKCAAVTDVAVEALAACCTDLTVLLAAHVRGVTDRALEALARARLPLRTLDLSGNTRVTDAGLSLLAAACQRLQDVRLHGCDRLSRSTVQRCGAERLPLTRALPPAPLAATVATGGGTATLALAGLPSRHVELLAELERRYRGAAALQARVRRWAQARASVHFLARRRLLRESRAAARIQRRVRAFLAWRRFLRLVSVGRHERVVVLVQARVRGRLGRAAARTKRRQETRAARAIQRALRPRLAARVARRHARAREIQRVFRGHRARALCRELLRQRRAAAATRIARWSRRCRRQQEVRARSRCLVRRLRAAQRQWRVHRARTRLRARVGFYRARAVRIQSAWRGRLARVRVAARRGRWTAAAVEVQRAFRGHRAREWTRRHRTTSNRSACAIQTAWRRAAALSAYARARRLVRWAQRAARSMLRVRRLRRVVRAAVERRRQFAARDVQRVFRGHLGRRRAVLLRKIRGARAARRGQTAAQALLRRRLVASGAALRIQTWVRAVLARRRMLRLRRWRRFLAAGRVQRGVRRWMRHLRARRRREAHTHAATAIQRVLRGHRGRRAAQRAALERRQRQAALLVQRVYRGHRGRLAFRHAHQECHAAARRLQRAFRTRRSRTLYEISLAVRALQAKEQHDRSLLGWVDARRHPMDELFRRARLPREKAVLEATRAKWDARRVAEERALRKLQRESRAADGSVWQQAAEAVENELAARRKLYGVTENVYATHRELRERRARREALHGQLRDLQTRVAAFKRALREASASRRMLEGPEVLELLEMHGLMQVGASSENRAGAEA